MKILSRAVFATVLSLSSLGASALAEAQQVSSNLAPSSMSEGEIRKIDKEGGKLTIRHEELKNLGMPAMTMVFRAKHPQILEQLKQGDKVRFVAEKVDGALTVTVIEKSI